MTKKPKLMIIGNARHGKDTVCEILEDEHGYEFRGSSGVALKNIIWPALAGEYQSRAECFKDRINHRALWFQLISFYNREDAARLIRDVYLNSDIYCGVRARDEFNKAREDGLFDCTIWVDASARLEAEGADSMELSSSDADIIIDNNGSLAQLRGQVAQLDSWLDIEFDVKEIAA